MQLWKGLNIPGFRVFQGSAYASVAQGSEYASILELGHFDKHFVKNTRKKDPARKHFEIFPPRYS